MIALPRSMARSFRAVLRRCGSGSDYRRDPLIVARSSARGVSLEAALSEAAVRLEHPCHGPDEKHREGELRLDQKEDAFAKRDGDAVIVPGDVNSTLACALTAAKLQIPVVHLEAGLRSFDRSMPEEINRIVTDAVSSLLLVSEASGCRNLAAEGVPDVRIRLVGNLMIDSLRSHLERAKVSGAIERLGISPPWGLITLHRPANVDDPVRLGEILSALAVISESVPLLFPVHPRTRARFEAIRLPNGARIRFLDPLGYLDFLAVMASSGIVLTDSGGVQEEAMLYGKRTFVARRNTERPESLELGFGELLPIDHPERLYERLAREIDAPVALPQLEKSPLTEGAAAKQINSILCREWG